MTNCPNCGGVLDITGHCEYCNTNVTPSLNVLVGYGCKVVEMNINILDSDGKQHLLPLEGYVNDMSFTSEPTSTTDYAGNTVMIMNNTEVEFTFRGRIRE